LSKNATAKLGIIMEKCKKREMQIPIEWNNSEENTSKRKRTVDSVHLR
jgi:hypothetical protein